MYVFVSFSIPDVFVQQIYAPLNLFATAVCHEEFRNYKHHTDTQFDYSIKTTYRSSVSFHQI